MLKRPDKKVIVNEIRSFLMSKYGTYCGHYNEDTLELINDEDTDLLLIEIKWADGRKA